MFSQNSTNEFRLPINHRNLYFHAQQIWHYFLNINALRFHWFVIYWLWFALMVLKPRWIFCQYCNFGTYLQFLKYTQADYSDQYHFYSGEFKSLKASHELRKNEIQNYIDLVSVILTEIKFQTGMRFSCEENFLKTRWIKCRLAVGYCV